MQLTNDQLIDRFNDLLYFHDEWLLHFHADKKSGYLSLSSQLMVADLKKNIKAHQYSLAWTGYDQLIKFVRENGSPEEIGDVDVICAWVESTIGRLSKVDDLLTDASGCFRYDLHAYSVIIWMKGINLWRQGGVHLSEAINEWKKSRRLFGELRGSSRQGKEDGDWYGERCNEIDQLILKIKKDPNLKPPIVRAPGYPTPRPGRNFIGTGKHTGAYQKQGPLPEQPGDQPGVTPGGPSSGSPGKPTPESPGSSKPGPTESTPPRQPKEPEPPTTRPKDQGTGRPSGWLRIYSTFEVSVNAGELRYMKTGPVDYIDITEVKIGKETYLVESLDSSDRMINLLNVKRPEIIHVTGDSMDAYPIEDGDYIVIKRVDINPFKDKSLSGKVVLTSAEDKDVNAQANIKILRYFGNAPHLEYMSASKEHKEGYQSKTIPFKKDWKLIGIVIARLTPKLETGV